MNWEELIKLLPRATWEDVDDGSAGEDITPMKQCELNETYMGQLIRVDENECMIRIVSREIVRYENE